MIGKIYCGGIHGVKGVMVSVEADVSDGLPGISMVGSLSSAVKEAQDRVWTAVRNSGFHLLAKKITVNLSPANLRKSGTGYDLAIALAILSGYGIIDGEEVADAIFLGELGLDGEMKPVHGVMPMVDEAMNAGFRRCFLPVSNVMEAAVIKGIQVFGVSHLKELVECLTGRREVEYCPWTEETWYEEAYGMDFSEVNGQRLLCRATEVAVAGMHNILYVGAAGTGKTMVARRIPTIMPSMTREESMEVSKIYSICGLLPEGQALIRRRPFRSPHHGITAQALIGGGQVPKPGEISLSSHGVMFLDELTEFSGPVLELLRQPLEEKRVTVARMGGSYEFPANCMLAAAMNPCKCGFYPDRKRCRCSESQVRQYLGKISRPFLERMDICVESAPVTFQEMRSRKSGEPSELIRERVERARQIQMDRLRPLGKHFNSEMGRREVEEYCRLTQEDEEYLSEVYQRLGLSPRGYERLLKVARTIADLAGSSRVGRVHLNEAVAYRSLEEKYWGGGGLSNGR